MYSKFKKQKVVLKIYLLEKINCPENLFSPKIVLYIIQYFMGQGQNYIHFLNAYIWAHFFLLLILMPIEEDVTYG